MPMVDKAEVTGRVLWRAKRDVFDQGIAQRRQELNIASVARFDRKRDSAVTDWNELYGEMIAIDATCLLLDDKSLTELYREVRGE